MLEAIGGMCAVAVVVGVFVSACFMSFGALRRLSAADVKLRAYYDEHPEKAAERKMMQEAGYKV